MLLHVLPHALTWRGHREGAKRQIHPPYKRQQASVTTTVTAYKGCAGGGLQSDGQGRDKGGYAKAALSMSLA